MYAPFIAARSALPSRPVPYRCAPDYYDGAFIDFLPMLGWIFISPAQPQIHQSVDRKHWDKNYGFAFAAYGKGDRRPTSPTQVLSS